MSHDDGNQGPLGYVFAVGDDAFCCWEYDHERRTLAYLDGIDCGYFRVVGGILGDHLPSTSVGLTASIALRVTYQQGLEALMTLLCAIVQAPHAIPAWIAKCTTANLTEMVTRLTIRRSVLTQEGWSQLTLEDLSQQIHQFAWVQEPGDNPTAVQFGRFWSRLAKDLLDDAARAEYNALKHGNRVSAGGFSLAVGVEEQPGVPAPPENMRSLGGSRFGSTFFVPEQVGTTKWHIRTRRTSVNWTADSLVQRLALISMSISNAAAAARCHLGVDPNSQIFHRPHPCRCSMMPGPTSRPSAAATSTASSESTARMRPVGRSSGPSSNSVDRRPRRVLAVRRVEPEFGELIEPTAAARQMHRYLPGPHPGPSRRDARSVRTPQAAVVDNNAMRCSPFCEPSR